MKTATYSASPAPFHVGILAIMNLGVLEICDAKCRRIATLDSRDYIGRTEELLSNATLFSAAPELLEALESLVNKLDEMAPTELNHRVPYTGYSRIGRAKAVIAKAKGR